MRGDAAAPKAAVHEGIMRKLVIIVLILIAIPVVWYQWNFPSVSYRYRLTVAVEVGGQVHSGSSVIAVHYSFNPKWVPPSWGVYNQYDSGQAVLIDLGARGVLVAALVGVLDKTGQIYDRCTIDARYLVGRAYEPSATRRPCAVGYPVTLDNERAISRMRSPVDLTSDNLPAFIWFSDNTDFTTAKMVKPNEFASVIGDAARLVSAQIEITSDPVVVDIDKRLPLYKTLPQPPRGGPAPLPNGLALHWAMFIAPWSFQ
jgi:hypothetical protein